MPKLLRGKERWFHWCPGCQVLHPIPDKWTFNGEQDTPTFRPDIRHRRQSDDKLCHYWIEKGRIRYVSDTTAHDLEVADMPEIPADYLE